MASIQKRGEYYYAFFRNHLGKRACVSTRSTDPKIAQESANMFEEASKLAREKTLTVERANQMLCDFIKSNGL